MSTKHTPGPLHFVENGDANHYMVVSENKWVMSIQFKGELTVEKQLEILKKITAAPKLLEALKKIRNYFGENDKTVSEHKMFAIADEAIKEATE